LTRLHGHIHGAAGFASRYGPLGRSPFSGLWTLRFDAGRSPPTPAACYRAPWRLPGPDSHRLATASFRSGHDRYAITSLSLGALPLVVGGARVRSGSGHSLACLGGARACATLRAIVTIMPPFALRGERQKSTEGGSSALPTTRNGENDVPAGTALVSGGRAALGGGTIPAGRRATSPGTFPGRIPGLWHRPRPGRRRLIHPQTIALTVGPPRTRTGRCVNRVKRITRRGRSTP
jgi:hypothetical protein